MKFLYPLLFLTCAALAVPTEIHERNAITPLTPLKDAHIVVLNDDVGDAETFFNGLNLGLANGAMGFYNHAMKGFSAQLDPAAVTLLRGHPQVVMVQPDQVHYGAPHENNAPYGLSYSSYPTKQNPAKTTDQYYWSYDGTGVTVYIIDSGILADQPQFQGRATRGPNYVTRQYGPVQENDNDQAGHGTAVAGCVGSESFGTAKGVHMVGIKVLNAKNGGTTAAIIAGIDYAVSNCTRPSKCVINQSTAGPLDSALDTAVQNAVKAGITYVVSAGNAGIDACTQSPADVAEAITVGAIDQDYQRPAFSNYGKCVDLSAAGVDVVTTTAGYPTYPERTISGTSFSAPYVAGIAAIYLSSTTGGYPASVRRDFREYGLHGAINSNNFTGAFASPNLIPTNGYYTGLYTANPVYNK